MYMFVFITTLPRGFDKFMCNPHRNCCYDDG